MKEAAKEKAKIDRYKNVEFIPVGADGYDITEIDESSNKQKQKIKNVFEMVKEMAESKNFKEWRETALLAYDYYMDEVPLPYFYIEEYKRLGQKPKSCNMIPNFLHWIVGKEISNRKSVIFESQGKKDWIAKVVGALTTIGLITQENSNYVHEKTNKILAGLITGIASGGFKHNYLTDKIEYFVDDTLMCIYDFLDDTSDFSNQRFFAKFSYVNVDDLCIKYPHLKKKILEKAEHYAQFTDKDKSRDLDFHTWTYGTEHRKDAKILEVEFKELLPAYKGKTKRRNYEKTVIEQTADGEQQDVQQETLEQEDAFITFYIEEAKFLTESKSNFVIEDAWAVRKVVFYDDIVLEDYHPEPFIPNGKDFSSVPLVINKHPKTNVPIGLVKQLMSLQDDFNYNYTNALLAAGKTLTQIDSSFLLGKDIEDVRREIMSKTGLLIRPEGTNVVFNHQKYDKETAIFLDNCNNIRKQMQNVIGIYNDDEGRPSNLTSGISQEIKTENSANSKKIIFDKIKQSQKREGLNLFRLITTDKNTMFECEIYQNEKKELIDLNKRVDDVTGKTMIFNHTLFLPANVVVKEIDNVSSSLEIDRDLQKTLTSQILSQIQDQTVMLKLLTNKHTLEMMGARDPYAMQAKFASIVADFEAEKQKKEQEMMQMMQQQQAEQVGGGEGQGQGYDDMTLDDLIAMSSKGQEDEVEDVYNR